MTRTATHEIRVAGHLDDHWAATLGDLTLVRLNDGTTSLTGPVVDQARLHGILARIRDLGAPLLSVRPVDGAGTSALMNRVRTRRLTLRPAVPVDADATWAYRRLPQVAEWLTEDPTDLGSYRAVFREPHRLAATVIVERGGEVIGDLLLRVEDRGTRAEGAGQQRGRQAALRWVLDPTRSGQGHAAEAVRGVLAYCFTELDVRRAVASCFLADVDSWQLMERVGMRREAHAVAESLHGSGQWLDTVTYALLRTERASVAPELE